ncbi:MAG: hypothetical protein ABH864_02915 [archaeon]
MEHFPLVDRLHTDVLEEKYGPIHSKVLVHDEKVRLSHLVDKKGISRTFAITFFQGPFDKNIKRINEEIKKGNQSERRLETTSMQSEKTFSKFTR